jgi:hypothetical protein
MTGSGALATAAQAAQQRLCVRGAGLPGTDELGERRIDYVEGCAELTLITNNNDIVDEAAVDERIAQLGANAGRLAGRDYERSVESQT